ncbi:MAG: LysR family transcriptional regulator [Propionibacteriales bacterium]|nr:LysR family transcriptional regulator [Propionibacteriales bacterium]
MTLDVHRLRVLAAVAQHGSMSGAAEALGYTVSAVSQQVRKLEAEVGQPVLERHSRGVTLTDAGRAVAEHAELIDRQLHSLRARLDDIAGLRAGSLRLGTFPTAGSSLLPLAVTRFRQEHPGVHLSVSSSRLRGLLNMLESRAVELALLWDYSWSRIANPGLKITHLLDDPTALIVSATHPLADRRAVRIPELAEEPWIIRADGHPVGELLLRSAHTAGFRPTIAFEANDYQEAQAMVAVGLGVAMVPRLALAGLRDDVRVLSLGAQVPSRRVLLARLAGRRPTEAESRMGQLLVEIAGSPSLLRGSTSS